MSDSGTFQNIRDVFNLSGRVAVITGGAGLLGQKHAEAIAAFGGIPVLLDVNLDRPGFTPNELAVRFGKEARAFRADITNPESVNDVCDQVLKAYGHVDILINNAANNPKMEASAGVEFSRLENFTMAQWYADLAVGLTGAFLCSQSFGTEMARQNRGVILNISSDLGVIGPDQRIYRKVGSPEEVQPVKPVTYSVVKTALMGLTRYLATYWADKGVRCNAISPGGVHNGQPDEFVGRLSKLIPMGRMSRLNEYQGAIVFLCSDASSYMTGANLVVDGGRSCW